MKKQPAKLHDGGKGGVLQGCSCVHVESTAAALLPMNACRRDRKPERQRVSLRME